MKNGTAKNGFTPPPHANRDIHARVMERLGRMSTEELFRVAVDAGIYAPNGDLTEAYGGTASAPADAEESLNRAG